MSEAYNALMGMTGDEVAAYSASTDVEEHIVIGVDRFITIPNNLKRIAVQYDHNVETVTFECPRFWDEHDLSEMHIYINYMLRDKTVGSYLAQNVTAVGRETVTFDWTISNNLTQIDGPISFLVCAKNTDSEGNEVVHWNSELNVDMYVSEGLETVEDVFVEAYPDIVTQLLSRMKTVEDISITADEMDSKVYAMNEFYRDTRDLRDETEAIKNAAVNYSETAKTYRDSAEQIKNETQGIVDAAVDEVRTKYANAIKGSASGKVVSITDVSPIEHPVEASVHFKNIVQRTTLTRQTNTNGIMFEVNDDGTISASGIATDTAYYLMQGYTDYNYQIPIAKGKYVISKAPAEGCRVTVGLRSGSSDTRVLHYSTHTNAATFEVTDDITVFDVILCVDKGYNVDAVFKPQVELGTESSLFTPYLSPDTNITVTRCTKNLANIDDKRIQAPNGTWGPGNEIATLDLPSGTYTASCDFFQYSDLSTVGLTIEKTGSATIYSRASSNESRGTLVTTFTIPEGERGIDIKITSKLYQDESSNNADCLFTNIQIELGENATDYEKSDTETYELAASTISTHGFSFNNRVTGMMSTESTMTVYSDDGVLIDVSYNRDASKVMNEILDELASKMPFASEMNSIEDIQLRDSFVLYDQPEKKMSLYTWENFGKLIRDTIDGKIEEAINALPSSPSDPTASELFPRNFDELQPTARKIQNAQTPSTLTFSAMSDVHYFNSDNTGTDKLNMAGLMGSFDDFVQLDFIANLGDMVAGNETVETTREAMAKLTVATNQNAKCPVLFARGNHDDNGWYSSGGSYGGSFKVNEIMNDKEWYQAVFGSTAKHLVTDPNRPYGSYGYFDDEKSKIRVFVLNSSDIPYVVEADGTYRYNSYDLYAYSNDQLNFVANSLMFEGKDEPSEWAALFLSHVPIDTTITDGYRFGGIHALVRGADCLLAIISAYRKGTFFKYSGTVHNANSAVEVANSSDFAVNIDIDYSSKGVGDVIGFINGHTHIDNYSNEVGIEDSLSRGYTYISQHGNQAFTNFVVDRETNTIRVVKHGNVYTKEDSTDPTAKGCVTSTPESGTIASGNWSVTYNQFRPTGENLYNGLSEIYKEGNYVDNSAYVNPDTLEVTSATQIGSCITSKAVKVKPLTAYAIPSGFKGHIRAFKADGGGSMWITKLIDGDGYKIVTTDRTHQYLVFCHHTPSYPDYANFKIKEIYSGMEF